MIKRIWKSWCYKVDRHNAPLLESWATSEEIWSYGTIFVPFLMGIGMTIVMALGIFCNHSLEILMNSGIKLLTCFIMITVVMGIGYFLNWKSYEDDNNPIPKDPGSYKHCPYSEESMQLMKNSFPNSESKSPSELIIAYEKYETHEKAEIHIKGGNNV